MTSHAQQPPTVCPAPAGPLHPALHFELGMAAVGILDAAGNPLMVQRQRGQDNRPPPLPTCVALEFTKDGQFIVGGRPVHPAPEPLRDLAGQWDAANLEAFCKDGAAPTFAEWMGQMRAELVRQIEFTRPEDASLLACWAAGTYFHPLFLTFSRLNINGPQHSGKSKTLQVLAAVAFNGLYQVLPTPAILFRLIEPLHPTFCIDEVEKLDRSDAKPIESIYNMGYKAGARVARTEGDSAKRRVVSYGVYTPMALAGIRGLHGVLADRAILVRMQPGLNKTRVNREVDPRDPVYAQMRGMGYRLALTGWPAVKAALESVRRRQDSFKHLAGRPLELYRPLLAVAILASHEGDSTFLADLSALVRDDADAREGLQPEVARLFELLEERLRAAPSITVSPGELIGGFRQLDMTAENGGRLLRLHGFKGRRQKAATVYTITREHFTTQARRYGYVVSPGWEGAEGAGQLGEEA